MGKNDKPHLLNENQKYLVGSEINPGDYIMMHKSQIKSLIQDDKGLNLGAELFDKLGAAMLGSILGVAISLEKISDIPTSWIILGIFGAASLGWGMYVKHLRNSKIDSFVNEVLKEKEST